MSTSNSMRTQTPKIAITLLLAMSLGSTPSHAAPKKNLQHQCREAILELLQPPPPRSEREAVRKYKSRTTSLAIHASLLLLLSMSGVTIAPRDNGALFSVDGMGEGESNTVIELVFAGDEPMLNGGVQAGPEEAAVPIDPNREMLEALTLSSTTLQAAAETADTPPITVVSQAHFDTTETSSAVVTPPAPPKPVAPPVVNPVASAAPTSPPTYATTPTPPASSSNEALPAAAAASAAAAPPSTSGAAGIGSGLTGNGTTSGAATVSAQTGDGLMNLVEGIAQSAKGARALDVVIAIDVSGSMGPHIEGVKAAMARVGNRLREVAAQGTRVRIGCVVFHDVEVLSPAAWVEFSLTSNFDEARQQMQKVYLRLQNRERNKEGPEDSLDALLVARDALSWDKEALGRIIVLSDHGPKPTTSRNYSPTMTEAQVLDALRAFSPSIQVLPFQVGR